jgi:hypothetical protein
MGIFFNFLQPHQHALRSSIKNWRLKVEFPTDFEDLGQRPFENPHFYSDSESDTEEKVSEEELENISAEPPGERKSYILHSAPPEEKKSYILHSAPLLPPIQHPNLVMQQVDYNNGKNYPVKSIS